MSKLVLNITEEGRGGGAMGRMRMMAKALTPAIETIILFPSSANQYKKSLIEQNIRYEELALHPLTKSKSGAAKYVLYFCYELYLLIRIIKKHNPDLIQANGCWQIKGVIAGKLTGTKVIWYMNDSYQPSTILKLFRFVSPYAFAFGHASQRTKKYYEKASPIIRTKMSAVISAPVNLNRIGFVKRQRKKKIVFLTVGYINIHKGLELLMKAAAQISDLDVEFHIVGPVIESQKKYKDSIDRLVEKLHLRNIKFFGYQTITTELLSQYDYYLCSSIREASPMAVWEAMASGLPVVSTDVGDVKDVLLSRQCGIVADDFEPTSLAVAIREILKINDSSYDEMSERARKGAIELFAVGKVSKDYLRYYTDVISESTN